MIGTGSEIAECSNASIPHSQSAIGKYTCSSNHEGIDESLVKTLICNDGNWIDEQENANHCVNGKPFIKHKNKFNSKYSIYA